ncbi:MAG: B12-binding domain-containing radical SAM protein [Planctomycetes bacterium]|nr:B12-binding domain-containing radical SAM protein [Planctomycetota bacterium]
MRCTLIRPVYRVAGYDEGTQECLGLGYVGGMLRRHGHEVHVVDAEIEKLSDDQVLERVAGTDPELVGMSLMSEDGLESAIHLAKKLRYALPKAHLTMGGNLASFAPDWVFRMCPHLDTVLRFEGEKPLLELATCLQSGRDYTSIAGLCQLEAGRLHMNAPAVPADDLDSLPFPLRDTLPLTLEQGLMPPLATSRGCQGKCTFCAVHRFNLDPDRPWRFRSSKNIADEIDRLVSDYGIEQVNFVDDDFIGNRKLGQPRARDLAAELKRRRLNVGFSLQCRAEWIDHDTFRPLKDAGLQMVFFGIEAVDQSTRRAFKKGQSRDLVLRTLALLKELDVYTHVGFIMFNPWTTLENVRESVEFLHDIGHLNIHTITNFLQLSPGTPLLEPLVSEGVAYREPDGCYRYQFADPRVASIKAVFDRVIWPHFPRWYESLMAKWSILSKLMQSKSPRHDLCQHTLDRFDDVVYEVAVRTLDALEEDPQLDLFALVRELRDWCRKQLEDVPELPPSPYRRQPLLCAE